MKQIAYLFLILLILSCSSSDDVMGEILNDDTNAADTAQVLAIKPYSYDMSAKDISIAYLVSGASGVDVMYKEQNSTEWDNAEIQGTDSIITAKLTNLRQNHYYMVMAIAHNDLGKSVTDIFTLLFDYYSTRGTYFMQPYMKWNEDKSTVMLALQNAGNILDAETDINGECHLEYRFKFKELKTEYIFDTEKKLKEALIYFDPKRVSEKDLQRFLTSALGYLATGNIHITMDGTTLVVPLYKTTEGSSYVFVYTRDENIIVDYMGTIDENNSITKE